MISSLPPPILRTRPGLSGRSGITNASREMPSASVIAKIRSISLSVTALSNAIPRYHLFYSHVADSLARLRCAPPSILIARRGLSYIIRTSQTRFPSDALRASASFARPWLTGSPSSRLVYGCMATNQALYIWRRQLNLNTEK